MTGGVVPHRRRRDGGQRDRRLALVPRAPVPSPGVLVVGTTLSEGATLKPSKEHILMRIGIVGHHCPLSARRCYRCYQFGPRSTIPAPGVLRVGDYTRDVI